MLPVTSKVIATVNAPDGARVTAEQLAANFADPASVESFDPNVFTFLSEVSPKFQTKLIAEMHGSETESAKLEKLLAEQMLGVATLKGMLGASHWSAIGPRDNGADFCGPVHGEALWTGP